MPAFPQTWLSPRENVYSGKADSIFRTLFCLGFVTVEKTSKTPSSWFGFQCNYVYDALTGVPARLTSVRI